jgi:hypothetical protein
MLLAGSRAALSVYTITCEQKPSVVNGRSYRQSEKKGHSPQLIVTLPVEKCSFMEPEMLLPCLQELITEPCHKTVQTSQKLGFYFFKIICNANNIRIRAFPVWSIPSSYYVPHSTPPPQLILHEELKL